jgi:hypothetical protein
MQAQAELNRRAGAERPARGDRGAATERTTASYEKFSCFPKIYSNFFTCLTEIPLLLGSVSRGLYNTDKYNFTFYTFHKLLIELLQEAIGMVASKK